MSSVSNVQNTNEVLSAIKLASAETGVDFDYLVATASRESSMNPQAKSKTSSAAGLFQFVERTWLDMVERHGDKIGLGANSSASGDGENGGQNLSVDKNKSEILALRHNPTISAYMAAQYTRESADVLEAKLGRSAKPEELYIAHFFGAGAAARFIQSMEENPQGAAAPLFPAAAKANRSVFYHQNGSAKSLNEVFSHLAKKHNGQPAVIEGLKPTISPLPLMNVQLAEGSTRDRSITVLAGNTATEDVPGNMRGILNTNLVMTPELISLIAELEAPGKSSSDYASRT